MSFKSDRNWQRAEAPERLEFAKRFKEQGNTLYKQVSAVHERMHHFTWIRPSSKVMRLPEPNRPERAVLSSQGEYKLAKVKYLKAAKAVDRSLHCENEEQQKTADDLLVR